MTAIFARFYLFEISGNPDVFFLVLRDHKSMNTQTINAMWETRPARIPSSQGGNAKIAGVCEGIGVRYQIDPTLIRILFVAAGLAGGGLGVYLVAWLIMPRFSTQYSPIEAMIKSLGDEYKKEKETGWWLLIALVIFGFSATSTSGDFLSGTSLVSLGLAFGAWYFLHTKQPTPPKVDTALIHPAPGFEMPTPPAWDPLGAVPSLWHLPEPGAATPPPAPKKKSHGWIWIAGAVIILGCTALASMFSGRIVDTMSEPASALIVVNSPDELQDSYDNGIGDLNLDLSQLGPLPNDRTVNVTHDLGDLDLTLPKDVPVQLQCHTSVSKYRVGESNCVSGLYNQGDGHMLTVNITSGIGDVYIGY